jgi:histidinol-phosphate phosphatase family protein
MRQVVILAGGKGTRLRERLGDLPKPLIPIGGEPLLGHQLALCRRHGFDRVLLLLGYGAEAIRSYCGDGRRWGVRVESVVEERPLGTAGAVIAAWDRLAERFLVMYGDEMLNVDLERMWEVHVGAGVGATLLVHPNDHPLDSDLVETDERGLIVGFRNRPHPAGEDFRNLVNAALYVVDRGILGAWRGWESAMDFGKDVFPGLVGRGERLLAYSSPEYIKDVGTPDRYDRVEAEYRGGVVGRGTLAVRQRAVFLDRDGTLNEEVDGVYEPDRLRLLPGVAGALRELNHRGWRTIVVTNQPGIAKGFCTEADVARVNRRLETLLGREHAFVDRIYMCPHHPERGFVGERPDLKIECECRKPRPGLVLRAAADLNVDLGASWLVGDSTVDAAAAAAAGVRCVLVRTGRGGQDGRHGVVPAASCSSVVEAVAMILRDEDGLRRVEDDGR